MLVIDYLKKIHFTNLFYRLQMLFYWKTFLF